MRKKILVFSSILLICSSIFGQERSAQFGLMLLSDFNAQAYFENDASNTYPTISKSTKSGFFITTGLGANLNYNLNNNILLRFGLGLKYTHLDLWYNNYESSDSKWQFFAKEQNTLTHVFTPVSIYYQIRKDKKLRFIPGISIEPNLLLHHNSSITTQNNDLLLEIYEPESTPSVLAGTISVNLLILRSIGNGKEIFCELKLHNTQRFFNEEFSSLTFPLSTMIIIGLNL